VDWSVLLRGFMLAVMLRVWNQHGSTDISEKVTFRPASVSLSNTFRSMKGLDEHKTGEDVDSKWRTGYGSRKIYDSTWGIVTVVHCSCGYQYLQSKEVVYIVLGITSHN